MKFHTEIVLHAFGNVDELLLKSLIPVLKERFHMDVVIGDRLSVPPTSHDRVRDQYLSTDFLEEMQDRYRSDSNIHLGVTDVDLYVPDLSFVFGEASPATWTAVFSTARFHRQLLGVGQSLSVEDLRQRAAIEAVHELGHVLGLPHCANPRCVMWFSNRIDESDRKGSKFCSIHRKEIDDLISEWSSQAPSHFHY